MKVKIGLLNFLEKICGDLFVPKPVVFEKNRTTVNHSVLIGFDGTKLPYRVVSGQSPLPESFYGEDAHTVDFAEHKAILCLLGHLKKTYSIEIHDNSHYKIKECEKKFFEMLSAMDSFVARFNTFLSRYEYCTEELLSMVDRLGEKYGHLSDGLNIQVVGFVTQYKQKIVELKKKILDLGNEDYDDIMAAVETTRKADPPKDAPNVWIISGRDILLEVLKAIGFEEAKYSNSLIDGDMFIGNCKLNLIECYGSKTSGRTKIQGEKKNSALEAEDSAACAAIGALERLRDVEVVDFNYDHLMLYRKRLCTLVRHRSNLDSLFSEANASWSSLISCMEEFLNDQYGLSQEIPLSGEAATEWSVTMSCVAELEESVGSMKQDHYLAVSTMAAGK